MVSDGWLYTWLLLWLVMDGYMVVYCVDGQWSLLMVVDGVMLANNDTMNLHLSRKQRDKWPLGGSKTISMSIVLNMCSEQWPAWTRSLWEDSMNWHIFQLGICTGLTPLLVWIKVRCTMPNCAPRWRTRFWERESDRRFAARWGWWLSKHRRAMPQTLTNTL